MQREGRDGEGNPARLKPSPKCSAASAAQHIPIQCGMRTSSALLAAWGQHHPSGPTVVPLVPPPLPAPETGQASAVPTCDLLRLDLRFKLQRDARHLLVGGVASPAALPLLGRVALEVDEGDLAVGARCRTACAQGDKSGPRPSRGDGHPRCPPAITPHLVPQPSRPHPACPWLGGAGGTWHP